MVTAILPSLMYSCTELGKKCRFLLHLRLLRLENVKFGVFKVENDKILFLS